MMRILISFLAVAVIIGGLTYHFAALKVFNALVSKDSGATLLAEAIAYGPDPRQRLDIYAPEGSKTGLPILLFVYGGSWKDGERGDYEFVGRAFAARGYLTINLDYRLLPHSQFPAFVEDVALAIAWAHKQGASFGGDPKRMLAVGHSAGAYNLALAVLNKHYLRDASVESGILLAIATLAGPFDFLPLDTRVTIDTFGKVAALGTTQPVNYVSASAPPFLILTGSADTTVYPRNSRSLARHLEDAGAAVELKEYEGMGHAAIMLALAKPLRKKESPVYEDILQFFARQN